MAFPTSVNDQVTDAITQSNVKVLGESPAVAMSNLYQTMVHSTGLAFENAVSSQNQQAVLAQSATVQGVMQIYSLDVTATPVAPPADKPA